MSKVKIGLGFLVFRVFPLCERILRVGEERKRRLEEKLNKTKKKLKKPGTLMDSVLCSVLKNKEEEAETKNPVLQKGNCL